MTTAADRLLGPLLDALLAARTQAAADAFDEAIATALAAGTLSADLGRQLRYWQRSSVHEVIDYVRTVLPAVLPGALDAVNAAETDAALGAQSAAQVWSGEHGQSSAQPSQPAVDAAADVPTPAEAVLSAPDEVVLPDTRNETADLADPVEEPDESGEDRSGQRARRRLFVAGLTSTA